MEVIEDGNIMDRIPILLQRDLEYYQTNQTVLSEVVCPSVVGGRLDFPRNSSFASVKIVHWFEDEFAIAFRYGSGMFTVTEDEESDGGIAKTSDPDKFVQLVIKSAEMLLEHLHVLTQEALDHADLPVLIAALGASALLKNSLHCYVQHLEDSSSSERHSQMQACYKQYLTMYEAVGERVLDLHTRVLSLYILQDSGGRPIDDHTSKVHESGSPSIQSWWLYMQGSRKDLWSTVPPKMAQRIFAGMLNETLTILNVRYCQTNTTDTTTPLLINDILNILLCVSQLLPSICNNGCDLVGFDVKQQTRDVRDVHAKCNELFKCMVYRGAELHFIHQVFLNQESPPDLMKKERPCPWYTFVNQNLFEDFNDQNCHSVQDLPTKTAIALDLIVLLAQPQPSWTLLVRVLMMRDCHLSRMLLIKAIQNMSKDNLKWPASGCWYCVEGKPGKCDGFLCTADGYCKFTKDKCAGVEYSRAAGALTYILASIGSKMELKSSLAYALEISGRDWAACLDKRQVWCDRRPSWLAGLMGMIGTALQFIPEILVQAIQSGASMYQTMSLCISCISRTLDCIPNGFFNATTVIEKSLPSHIHPVGGSVMLQLLITVVYEELQLWSCKESVREKADTSLSFDGTQSSPSGIAIAVAEALCFIDEDDKHTQELEKVITQSKKTFTLSSQFGLGDFPEFAGFLEEGNVPGSNAERSSDASALTTQLLMTSPGRDSLRVVYDHIQLHCETIYRELHIQEVTASSPNRELPLHKAPLLYIMFHIGRRTFDQYLRGEWPMPWSRLVSAAKSWSDVAGARVHITRRSDFRDIKSHSKTTDKMLLELCELFKTTAHGSL